MPKITITVSQKVIDRAQVLTDEYNARTGESLTKLQLAAQIIRKWASAQGVAAIAIAATEASDVGEADRRRASVDAAINDEIATWD